MKLSNGMVVTIRTGDVFTVVYDYDFDGIPFNVLWDGKKDPSIFVEDYMDDLTMRDDCELLGTEWDRRLHPKNEYDIIKIEQDGKVIWERP